MPLYTRRKLHLPFLIAWEMFINSHIRFIISGHNSDNQYKNPSASYLEQGSRKLKSPYFQTPDFPIPTIF